MKDKTCKTCKCGKNETIKDLKEQNKKLQDEVDSLWAMMDEIAVKTRDFRDLTEIARKLRC